MKKKIQKDKYKNKTKTIIKTKQKHKQKTKKQNPPRKSYSRLKLLILCHLKAL